MQDTYTDLTPENVYASLASGKRFTVDIETANPPIMSVRILSHKVGPTELGSLYTKPLAKRNSSFLDRQTAREFRKIL